MPVPGTGQGRGSIPAQTWRAGLCVRESGAGGGRRHGGGGRGGRNAQGSIYARAPARVTHTRHHPHRHSTYNHTHHKKSPGQMAVLASYASGGNKKKSTTQDNNADPPDARALSASSGPNNSSRSLGRNNAAMFPCLYY